MTIRKHFENYLCGKMMFPNQATVIMDAVASEPMAPMLDRWNDSVGDYSDSMIATLKVVVDEAAVKWIDANMPQHFARAMFVK